MSYWKIIYLAFTPYILLFLFSFSLKIYLCKYYITVLLICIWIHGYWITACFQIINRIIITFDCLFNMTCLETSFDMYPTLKTSTWINSNAFTFFQPNYTFANTACLVLMTFCKFQVCFNIFGKKFEVSSIFHSYKIYFMVTLNVQWSQKTWCWGHIQSFLLR